MKPISFTVIRRQFLPRPGPYHALLPIRCANARAHKVLIPPIIMWLTSISERAISLDKSVGPCQLAGNHVEGGIVP